MASATEGTIVHSQLTDPQLHEPKGVATASSGSLYFADGEGSGAWKVPAVSDLSFIKGTVEAVTDFTGEAPASLDTSLLTQTGLLKDASTFQEVNADIKVLATKINEVITLLEQMTQNSTDTTDAVNGIRTSLINIGIFGE